MPFRTLFLAFLLCAPTTGSIANPKSEKVIWIGYQKSGVFLLLRNEGSLEKKFAPLGYTIEWREFSYGSPILRNFFFLVYRSNPMKRSWKAADVRDGPRR
jgi:ABC-type nitrate/sulfonate/bicarbonate transport system substrate-binding protein